MSRTSEAWTAERDAEAERLQAAVIGAQWALAEATRERDEAIRRLLAEGVGVFDIGQRFDMTRSRVYQIRDGRR